MIKRDILENLLTFMKTTLKKRFTPEQIAEIKKRFCVSNKEANNKVYWDSELSEFTFSEHPDAVVKFLEGERHNKFHSDQYLSECDEFLAKFKELYPEEYAKEC